MPFAIELFLDARSSTIVRSVWSRFAQEGLGAVLQGRPHVTLTACDDIDLSITQSALREFAVTYAPSPVQFGSIGTFSNGTSVVFLAPVVTARLAAVHAEFCDTFQRRLAVPWDHYRPENWIPHCTLAQELDTADVPAAIDICQQIELPFFGTFEAIGIVEFPALIEHGTYLLTGNTPF